jgi:hypothetical protein
MPGFESEYPGNSHRSKKEPEPVEEKKIERVTEGPVIRKKTPLGRRFASLFIAGDSTTVTQYVIRDVLLPGARDMVTSAVTEYVERMVYGEGRTPGRSRPGATRSSGGPAGYVTYNRFASKPTPEAPRAGISARNRATHNFDDIILGTRFEATEVLDKMFDTIARYEQVTVADFYEMVGETGSYTDRKWGWTDITGADIRKVRTGYLIILPEPIDLKD